MSFVKSLQEKILSRSEKKVKILFGLLMAIVIIVIIAIRSFQTSFYLNTVFCFAIFWLAAVNYAWLVAKALLLNRKDLLFRLMISFCIIILVLMLVLPVIYLVVGILSDVH